MIEEVRIKLSALWVVLMLTYLLGDVLRIFSGDFVAGEVSGMEISQGLMLGWVLLWLYRCYRYFPLISVSYRMLPRSTLCRSWYESFWSSWRFFMGSPQWL
jgi:hypothetical protein